NAERGFSFSFDGPLDMRMSQSGTSATDFINAADEKEIADVIFKYGDERRSRQIAKNICEARKIKPIATTKGLAGLVAKVFGGFRGETHPATRTFQAIRIYINQEFEQLERALEKAVKHLKANGVLAVISFHSGEDAIVKAFFNEKTGKNENFNRYLPENNVKSTLLNKYLILSRKPIPPSESEVLRNVRARSAKLRGLKKL
ncbi:MAG TPA: 16S rRNA (cytosine(1402)-N(4))-methyltransferase, partial [Alphaproteobacteria bacterium]|nr:16S rRNA (cytosine(1402)-N(4))-methyltransferase [Alphaproteobacteria bacterium]